MKIAPSRPQDHNLPFSTWSLTKLAEFLVAEGVVDDISHEGVRDLLRKHGVSFQVIKTFKQSNDPDYEAKKNRVLTSHVGGQRWRPAPSAAPGDTAAHRTCLSLVLKCRGDSWWSDRRLIRR
jgi:hypothetical protein